MAWDPQQRELVRLGPFLLHLVRDRAVLSQQTLSSVRIWALGPGPWQLPRLAEWWESSRLQTCQYSDLQKRTVEGSGSQAGVCQALVYSSSSQTCWSCDAKRAFVLFISFSYISNYKCRSTYLLKNNNKLVTR